MADKFDKFMQRFDNDSEKESLRYNILFPVFNDEKKLESGIRRTVSFLDRYMKNCDYMLTVVDTGSTDYTAKIAGNLCREFAGKVFYQYTPEKGEGAAFRAGVLSTTADVVGYMDIDLSTDLRHLVSVYNIFQNKNEVVMVNGSTLAKGAKVTGRKKSQTFKEKVLAFIMKMRLGMKASDAACGFKFFRRKFVETVMLDADENENGQFYIFEILIRTERSGETLVELPVRYLEHSGGQKKTFSRFLSFLKKTKQLKKQFKYEEEHEQSGHREILYPGEDVSPDSLLKRKKPYKYVEGKAVIEFYTEEEKENQWK